MVRINRGYALKQIVDDHVIVATGDNAVKFSAILVLNEVGTLVFKQIQDGETEAAIAQSLVQKFGIDEATAAADVARFVEKLVNDGVCSRE